MSDVESESDAAGSNDVSDSENEEGSEQEGSGQDDSGDDDGAESGGEDVAGEDAGEQVDGAESEQRLEGCGRTKTQSEVRMLLKSLLRQVQV